VKRDLRTIRGKKEHPQKGKRLVFLQKREGSDVSRERITGDDLETRAEAGAFKGRLERARCATARLKTAGERRKILRGT